jgi:hypothetical protein
MGSGDNGGAALFRHLHLCTYLTQRTPKGVCSLQQGRVADIYCFVVVPLVQIRLAFRYTRATRILFKSTLK